MAFTNHWKVCISSFSEKLYSTILCVGLLFMSMYGKNVITGCIFLLLNSIYLKLKWGRIARNFLKCHLWHLKPNLNYLESIGIPNMVTQTLWRDEIVLVHQSWYGPNVAELNYVEVDKDSLLICIIHYTPASFAN